jgi:MinD-like ATPase involved in chromosome partitioning or flagellar assembly
MSERTVIMATGQVEINEILKDELKSLLTTVDQALFKADVISKVDRHKPHVLILSDTICTSEEKPPRETFIQDIRRRFPGTHLIYIYDAELESTDLFIRFLISQQIFDFLPAQELDLLEFMQLLREPRQYIDVKHHESNEKQAKPATEGAHPVHQEQGEESQEHREKIIVHVPVPYMEEQEPVRISQKQKTVLFSASAATGKSFIAQNTAVYLAEQDPEIDIALIDMDILKPTIATRMRLNQSDKESRMYLEELLQRIDGNRFDGDLLREFMYVHPKFKNLHIFNCEFKRPEYRGFLDTHHVEKIFEILKEEYTLILVDTNRDIELVGHDVLYKKASMIYHVVDYDFSSCLDFQKSRRLLEQIPFIQKKPKRIVLNKAFDHPKFTPELILSFFSQRETDPHYIDDHLEVAPVAAVPLLYKEQINAIYEGYTLVESKSRPNEPFISEIQKVADSIHTIHTGKKKTGMYHSFKRKWNQLRVSTNKLRHGLQDDGKVTEGEF